MGVPLPHLVLPLSGCLIRRTLARATRCEAREHKSVLAHNPLFMCPPFPSFGLVVGLVCRRHMVDWSQCVCAAVVAFLSGVVRLRYVVDIWVADGHTARWPWLCVLSVHRPRCGCRPVSGMSTPSRCRGLAHSRFHWCRGLLGHNGSATMCVCVCGNRGRRTHNGYPRGSGRVG